MIHTKIAFTAKLRSGKTEAAKFLEQQGYERISLADPVKDACVDMLNAFLRSIGDSPWMTRAILERDKSVLRWLPQKVGTDLGRNYIGPQTIWIEKYLLRVKAYETVKQKMGEQALIVCDDLRFQDEAAALRANGFTIVRLVREEQARLDSVKKSLTLSNPSWNEEAVEKAMNEMMNHGSEQEVDLIDADFSIANTSLVWLEHQMKQLAGFPMVMAA